MMKKVQYEIGLYGGLVRTEVTDSPAPAGTIYSIPCPTTTEPEQMLRWRAEHQERTFGGDTVIRIPLTPIFGWEAWDTEVIAALERVGFVQVRPGYESAGRLA